MTQSKFTHQIQLRHGIAEFNRCILDGDYDSARKIANKIRAFYGNNYPRSLSLYINKYLADHESEADMNEITHKSVEYTGSKANLELQLTRASALQIIRSSNLFDATAYSKQCSLDNQSEDYCIMHYLSHGEGAETRPFPLFDVNYYAVQLSDNNIPAGFLFAHFLSEGWKKNLDPCLFFSVKYYLDMNPDVHRAGINPLSHFYFQGAFEGRSPHPAFPIDRVLNRVPELKHERINPLVYWMEAKWKIDPCPEASFYFNVSKAHDNSVSEISSQLILEESIVRTDIRCIAIHLPQFHVIPENNEWWGEGFTEWTNVRRGKPYYHGHYQPHVPHDDIGYYDLGESACLEAQAILAKKHGIEGFCFYYYWFNGRRLLHKPLDAMLTSGKPDFPFCFCWANENWTRTWDGGDNEILIAQNHNPESDKQFILDLLPVFRDKRYIRVNGKPLLIVYRPGLLPNPAETAARWRQQCREAGIGEIFLAYMQNFDWELDGKDIGFDVKIQFPPVSRPYSPDISGSCQPIDPETFIGRVHDYIAAAANYAYDEIGSFLWPGVCPSWDNTARKMERGISWTKQSPHAYFNWLKVVVDRARRILPSQERFVFVNAWNEWGEGCHLEPDNRFGYSWLNATRMALANKTWCQDNYVNILVVGHDAARAGAQIVLLSLLKNWKKLPNIHFKLILVRDGVLRSHYENICHTIVMSDYAGNASKENALRDFIGSDVDLVLSNTVVNGPFLQKIKYLNVPIITYVHELQKSIERWAPGEIMQATVHATDYYIAVSRPVENNLIANHHIPKASIDCLNPYIDTSYEPHEIAVSHIRKELCLAPTDLVVMGCGTVDWRKGPDLFIEVAKLVLKEIEDARFIWIGGSSGDEAFLSNCKLPEESAIQFLGEKENARDYLAISNVFFLSSREDPYPLVALEAADAALPIVCFEGAGGIPEFVKSRCGIIVNYEDTEAASEAIVNLLRNERLRISLGNAAQDTVRKLHDSITGSQQIYNAIKNRIYGLSLEYTAIVPNYNCANFLQARLDSVCQQTVKPKEVIVLDDASSDGSLSVIADFARSSLIPIRIILNPTNSGSPFVQWKRGLEEANTDIVWIAEADDESSLVFVQKMARFFKDESVVLAYAQTHAVDSRGYVLSKYFGKSIYDNELRKNVPALAYTDTIDESHWLSSYVVNGEDEVSGFLGLQNTIPNVSSVLMRREPALKVIDESIKLRNVGDWLFYINLARLGKIAFDPAPLNFFRRHGSSTTARSPIPVILESIQVVYKLVNDNLIYGSNLLDSVYRRFLEYEWEVRGIKQHEINEHPEVAPFLAELRRALNLKLLDPLKKSILIVLPDGETGGGQSSAVRTAISLTSQYNVFLVNARPRLCDANLLKAIPDHMLFLEGRLASTAHLRFSTTCPNRFDSDTTEIRVCAISAMISWLDIDTIISHVWWADKFSLELCKRAGLKWFVHMHGCYEYLLGNPNADSSFAEIAPQILRRATGFLYLNDKNLKVFEDLNFKPSRIQLVRNGLADPGSSRGFLDAAPFPMDENDLIVCMCARGIREKGWQAAIDAILRINNSQKLKGSDRLVRLVLIGSGSYLDDLQQQYPADSHVHFLGLHPNPVDVMKHCHIGVLPSYFISETQPYSIIEYLATGLAVIATRIGSIPDMLQSDGMLAGAILDASDPSGISSSLQAEILRLIHDPVALSVLRGNARKIFLEKYEIKAVAKHIIDFIS